MRSFLKIFRFRPSILLNGVTIINIILGCVAPRGQRTSGKAEMGTGGQQRARLLLPRSAREVRPEAGERWAPQRRRRSGFKYVWKKSPFFWLGSWKTKAASPPPCFCRCLLQVRRQLRARGKSQEGGGWQGPLRVIQSNPRLKQGH